MQLNKIHNIDFLHNELPAKCANLIIADPPYFEVKGSFDFIWNSFDDYLKDVEKWAIECKRLLADNGTLFWYGDRKKIAYSQVVLDKYFNLENSIYLRSATNSMTEQWTTLRSFYEVGFERLLMYSNEISQTGLEAIKLDINNFQTLRQYFKELQEFIGTPKSKIVQQVGQTADHCFRWGSTQFDLPTIETYNELIKYYKINDWGGFKEYETLRQEYETLRRPFNNYLKLQDNWYFTKGNANSYDHETVKSEKQTRAMILTCSRPNDLVLVPFAGSGTEMAMSAKEGRRCVGFDIEPKYCDMANKRLNHILSTPQLFTK
jgi:site-specific DNA-methyltransferase (adenine-specific)